MSNNRIGPAGAGDNFFEKREDKMYSPTPNQDSGFERFLLEKGVKPEELSLAYDILDSLQKGSRVVSREHREPISLERRRTILSLVRDEWLSPRREQAD